ncbi:DUF1361 domain-containing protein [Paenibacillus barcinonensis]|uniref:DUF1361 domain-containing protein n=1 Tax=Paenibacillus barcinonensis TaxID=198119 RepID=A0A2V4VB96_PAEBA|nr:DUF1361 domain-containing protein [Paenibacillus barcinonensis]PYE49637.1 putative membrane protein [Paenibacillus barcinonensis]QKS56655.1 DUF1361 domain-containing protein [Paenibacillus barcinonensis]
MRDKHDQLFNKKFIAVTFTLLLMTLCCLSIAAYLRAKSGSGMYAFLSWDMFLAWVPLLISSLMAYVSGRMSARHRLIGVALKGVFGLVWLFFLPNAAYLFTEMLHTFRYFTVQPGNPFWYSMDFWYSLSLTFGVAITGLLLSTCSIMQIQQVLHKFIHRLVCWIIVGGILLLSSLGVYIGRFNRWNSWDIVSRPGQIVMDLLNDFKAEDGILLEFVTLLFVVQGFLYVMISLLNFQSKELSR